MGGLRENIKYFDIYRERPVRLTVRALVPVKEHPKVLTETLISSHFISSLSV